MSRTETSNKKTIYSSLIKWGFIFALLAFAIIQNKEFALNAIREVKKTTFTEVFICITLANLYFVFEGFIISRTTKTGEPRLGVRKGIVCAYMCAFYRLATLGSGNGIAQLYYYNVNGISVSNGTGMALSQYTIQKITIALYGIFGFAGIILSGDSRILKYGKFMVLGTVVIGGICLFLILITVSKKISDFLMMLARKIVKEKSKLYPKLDVAQESINCLQNMARKMWSSKSLFFQVMLLNICKFTCWYSIPGILFFNDFPDVNLVICTLLMAICNMIGCVMVAPSGVGTLEFVFALFFGTIIPGAKAIAATIIIYRLFTWILPFAIGIIPALFVKKR